MKGESLMNDKSLELNFLEENRDAYLKNEKFTVLRHALSANPFDNVFASKDHANDTDFTFSIDVKTLPATDQQSSGRCWIFSACNVIREIIAKKCNIKGQFELSENYIAYFDKLEKYNYFANALIELLLEGKDHDDRTVSYLLAGVGDGGQWQMFVELVKKYGVMPKANFPENAQSGATLGSRNLANATLRKFAADIYHAYEKHHDVNELYEIKKEYNKKIFNLFSSSFGVPPKTFDFEWVDQNDKYHIEKGLAPKGFFEKYIGSEIDEYVSLIHAPTKDKKYNHMYALKYIGNVVEGKDITHLNINFDRLEELIIKQLKDNEIVWFGSDVGKFRNRDLGVWDDKGYDYKSALDLDVVFDKADMLDFRQSSMGHAMCITGVNLKDNEPIRWKIENSWGTTGGKEGYYVMSESFFRSFVFQVAIKKKYLNEVELKALKEEPEILPPWDPFGTLAE